MNYSNNMAGNAIVHRHPTSELRLYIDAHKSETKHRALLKRINVSLTQ